MISTKHESWEGVLYKKDNVDSIICGNTLDVLRTMPDESIDCCITSPPYWGLRDYGIDSQLGLEPTFQLYIEHLLEIFDQVHRVLKKTGTCWVNLGDTYAGSWGHSGHRPERTGIVGHHYVREGHPKFNPPSSRVQSVQAKALCNIPHRFAISMTDHKWIQRNTIIWHKPSCMPSSAKDRFTVDFEYVFLFARSRKYYFEQQFEPYAESTLTETGYNGQALKDYESAMAQNPSDTKRRVINSIDTTKGRNRRCVWRTNSASYKGAHFAVFPEKLVEPMILAGCPSAICDSCGVPFETITNGPSLSNRPRSDVRKTSQGAHGKVGHKINEWRKDNPLTARVKKCDCGSDTHAGIVLDPFVGSGTTALVARKLGRHYIGIDLNPNYCDMANKRLAEVL